MRNSVKLALGLLRRGAGYTWTTQADSSDSALLNGYDPLVTVYDGATYQYYGKASGTWKLLWVDTDGALLRGDEAGAYPVTLASDGPGDFGTAYGLATQRLAGNVTQGTAFSHEADCLIEWQQVALPTGTDQIWFRILNAANRVYVYLRNDGSLTLYERVDDVAIARGSISAGTIQADTHFVVTADGSAAKLYNAGVLHISTDEIVRLTETDGERNGTPALGVVSDLITWPRRPTTAQAAALEAAVTTRMQSLPG